MMRRAPNTNATQEVRVEDVLSCTELRTVGQTQEVRGIDILEEFPLDRDETPSMAPFEIDIAKPAMSWPAMDARRAESTFDIEAPPPPPRRFRMIVAGAMVFSGIILGGAGIRAVLASSESNDAPRAATTVFVRMAPTTTPHAAPGSAAAIAQPAITTAPLAGTITLGPRARPITIDGTRLTPTTSVIVPCGEHIVRVGKAKAQTIDVPCGGSILVKAAGKTGR